ncbi:phage portal protein [Clostridium botulinum C]|uniref:Phage portal protein n=2 Tax=Clostridium botulinum TaxID=1491 RepID=A0A9Q4XX24_CLOBO|nr:terminase small subunit [Clostridium botulinum]MCD3194236.1 phage portal protein [Clostridium botulinum C]MCD3199135.1 phage portal protein [Clostridium botulinum C]MCD3204610.1 phage portal protein [Clostridium botulinum C]MCD3207953.1 phage portal protein [Clostridium botulinum C]MCD3225107.1 phage portal protein [Clostridium botulinum C]
MIDIRGPDKEIIKKAYETGNYTFKKLSDEFGISLGTIKSWAKRDKDNGQPWIKNKAKKVATKNKGVATKSKIKNIKEEPIAEEVKEVLENTQLTDKQRLFCIYYIKYFNATKAYQKAYNSSYIVANSEGYKLLVNPCIKAEIEKLKQHKLNQIMLNEEDIFQRYMDIAFSDIGDYLSFKKVRKNKWTKNKDGEDIPVINPDTGEQDYYEYNVVELNNSKELDTSILQEVSEGKDGVKIKLQDKMKALQWLADHMGIATEEQKARIEKLKIDIENIKGNNTSDEQVVIVDDI